MQKANKTPIILFIISILSAIIFTAWRIVLLETSFDAESGFFASRSLVTALYLSLIILSLFFVFIKKKAVTKNSSEALERYARGITNRIFNLLLALSFLLLAIFAYKELTFGSIIEKAAYYLIVASSLLSSIFYLFFTVIGEKKLYVFNVFPILTMVGIIVYSFIRQSIFANTYNEFSFILALLGIAFMLLSEGKSVGGEDALLPSYLALIPLVLQWSFPNLVIIDGGRFEMLAIIVSGIYFITTIIKTVIIICEDKK